jgi:hypothetical protein
VQRTQKKQTPASSRRRWWCYHLSTDQLPLLRSMMHSVEGCLRLRRRQKMIGIFTSARTLFVYRRDYSLHRIYPSIQLIYSYKIGIKQTKTIVIFDSIVKK